MYTIKKISGLFSAISLSGRVQFSSLKRGRVEDWIAANGGLVPPVKKNLRKA